MEIAVRKIARGPLPQCEVGRRSNKRLLHGNQVGGIEIQVQFESGEWRVEPHDSKAATEIAVTVKQSIAPAKDQGRADGVGQANTRSEILVICVAEGKRITEL